MKQTLPIFISLITMASFSQGTITGRIVDSTTNQPLVGTRITLLTIKSIKLDSAYDIFSSDTSKFVYHFDTSWNRIKSVYSDSLGFYQIDSVGTNYYKVNSFFYIKEEHGRKIGEGETSQLFQVVGNQKKYIDFKLGVFCVYDVTKDLIECPNCHKSDGVRIQVYGMPIYGTKAALEDDGKHYYNGYCVIYRCQPTKICLKCKAEF